MVTVKKSTTFSKTPLAPGICGKAYGLLAPSACDDDDADFLNELNHFLGRFEALNCTPAGKAVPHWDEKALCLDTADVRRTLRRVNTRKAPGPDNIPGQVLRECADQLAYVLTDIFNTSLDQDRDPTCFKTATKIPVPKNLKSQHSTTTSPSHSLPLR